MPQRPWFEQLSRPLGSEPVPPPRAALGPVGMDALHVQRKDQRQMRGPRFVPRFHVGIEPEAPVHRESGQPGFLVGLHRGGFGRRLPVHRPAFGQRLPTRPPRGHKANLGLVVHDPPAQGRELRPRPSLGLAGQTQRELVHLVKRHGLRALLGYVPVGA